MTILAPRLFLKRLILGVGLGLGATHGAMAQAPIGWSDEIPDPVWAQMQGVSWHADMPCPARAGLRLLHVPYRNFQGVPEMGHLIVAADLADEVLAIFGDLFLADFRFRSVRLVSEFGGDDTRSMEANNTSAFNCRLVAGTSRLSRHALGRAIDINPVQNPFVTRRGTSPAAGEAFDEPHERRGDVVGIVPGGGVVVDIFARRGWEWGGHWMTLKDYQHFSKGGG